MGGQEQTSPGIKMIDTNLVKQRLPLAWAADEEFLHMKQAHYQDAVTAKAGDFQFYILEYDRLFKGCRFTISVVSGIGSCCGIFYQDCATLKDAIAAIQVWIKRTILDLSLALSIG